MGRRGGVSIYLPSTLPGSSWLAKQSHRTAPGVEGPADESVSVQVARENSVLEEVWVSIVCLSVCVLTRIYPLYSVCLWCTLCVCCVLCVCVCRINSVCCIAY